MTRAALADEIAITRRLCRALGLGEVAPVLLKAAHHTTLGLPGLSLVARIQSAEPTGAALETARREIAVARHLAARGGPALAPLCERLAGPHVDGPAVVTLWPDAVPERVATEGDAAFAAAALGRLHDALADYPGPLPPYTDMLDRCWRVLAGDALPATLASRDVALLRAQYRGLRDAIEDAPVPSAPLHGDVHPGNLLIGADGPVWIDFEAACIGPREYDIAGLPRAVRRRFAGADPVLVECCADLRSVCVAVWCWAEVTRSAEIRAAAIYHLRRVRRMAR